MRVHESDGPEEVSRRDGFGGWRWALVAALVLSALIIFSPFRPMEQDPGVGQTAAICFVIALAGLATSARRPG